MAGFCGNGKGPSGSINVREFVDELSDFNRLLKKNHSLCSYRKALLPPTLSLIPFAFLRICASHSISKLVEACER